MSHQTWLDGIVDRFELRRHLDLVTGLSGATGGLKAVHLSSICSVWEWTETWW